MSWRRLRFTIPFLLWATGVALGAEDDGVFVRFRLLQPENARYHVQIGGFVHVPNWYLPEKAIPSNADKNKEARLRSGEFTEWFDLRAYIGKSFHGRLNRAGGIAELPNVTARFITEPEASRREIEIELASAADPAKVVKRWHESFEGNLTSFLVSSNLASDAPQLESANEMAERRLRWAREATGGVRHAPKELVLQTQ